MVLVDGRDGPEYGERGHVLPWRPYPLLARLGVLRLAGTLRGRPANDPVAAFQSRPGYFEAVAVEEEELPEDDREARAAGSLGDRPLIVISHGLPTQWKDLPPAQAEAAERDWQEDQQELLGLSSNSVQVVASQSGHFVQATQPDLVIAAVRHVVEAARAAPVRMEPSPS